jgi:hypothetical protein
MVTTKPKDKNSMPANDTCEDSEEDDFGIFEVFRANNIPGHNKSIQLLASLLESDNYAISELKAEYNNGPGITIFTHGSSNTEYKIEVFSQPILLAAFDNKMANLDDDGSKILTILSTFCPLIIQFKVYAHNPIDCSWDSICIEPVKVSDFSENQTMPHLLDVTASVALALVDDLTSAKFESMSTLRRSLLRHWKYVWLLNKNSSLDSIDEFVRIGAELFNIDNGKKEYWMP